MKHQDMPLFRHSPTDDLREATLRVDLETPSPHPVNPYLYGKFCEHLGANIYGGMEAQILHNPTFGKWRFRVSSDMLDGGFKAEHDPDKIAALARWHLRTLRLPEPPTLLDDYRSGAAFGWFRLGTPQQVILSPDVGPYGGRAQRIEIQPHTPLNTPPHAGSTGPVPPAGLAQWIHLPLHRTRGYEYRVVARAACPATLSIALWAVSGAAESAPPLATARLPLTPDWSTHTGRLNIPTDADIDPNGLYQLALVSDQPANIVLGRVLLYPDDHVNHADPDVIRMLRESRLPLLRWPGGNFVSGYHWRDGIGPVDQRPTLPNPAWAGLESNLFGTHEFIDFCRQVGCEPVICVNAGDGTAREAADWVQYCNGSTDTPMGRLRAQNGHPEPFNIRYWETGNELWGKWQISWTTPGGKLDRYLAFNRAMKLADPQIFTMGCGCHFWPDNRWDTSLICESQGELACITDHILDGGMMDPDVDPTDLYHAFMGQPVTMARRYRRLRETMLNAGIASPRLAITEVQLYPRTAKQETLPTDDELRRRHILPTPDTISEALYSTLIIHECIRLGDFVEMITHTGTVNHGGGLRKLRERVFANPVHHAHALAAPLHNSTPLPVDLTCGTFASARGYGHIPPHDGIPILDAMAVRTADGRSLILMLIHRCATAGPVTLDLDIPTPSLTADAQVHTLAGATIHDRNTLEEPDRITPRRSTLRTHNGRVRLTVPPFSLTRVTFPLA
jgi:alpha-L-arabinofuranosidase